VRDRLANAIDVGARPGRIDYTGSGPDQGLAQCGAGDAPDLTISFPDHLGAIDVAQRCRKRAPGTGSLSLWDGAVAAAGG